MNQTTLYQKPWARCVGSDRLSTMLRSEYWERFRQVRAAIPFAYIRCHGLLDDELGVLRIDEWEGKQRFFVNHGYLDQIFDTMLAQGVRPFIEWGFMPQALASGPESVFWWNGLITPPSDHGLWARLVSELTLHWLGRYGAAEVRSWPFEVWNEPNIEQFWKGADQAAYFKLYETTVKAVKAVDPAIRVGGPAICGGSDHWIEEFLSFVTENKLPLDFFSRHLYTAKTPTLRTPELLYQNLADPESPVRELREVRRRIDEAGHSHLPLHITEFNTSYHPLCPVHDTPLNAAYLARLLSEAGELVDTLSYWTFSDLFEEADVPRAFFHGGFGMLARGGVPKPTFHLFAFFAKLGSEVVHRGPHSLTTRRPDGTLALVAWNPSLTEEGGTAALAISVPWSGEALVRRQRVHESAGNPWGVWVALGRPRFPDAATVDFLRSSSVPALETAVLSAAATLELNFNLQRNEITLLEISPFIDESPTYLGLNDALIDGYTSSKRLGGLS